MPTKVESKDADRQTLFLGHQLAKTVEDIQHGGNLTENVLGGRRTPHEFFPMQRIFLAADRLSTAALR
jgi:hypothetical protein